MHIRPQIKPRLLIPSRATVSSSPFSSSSSFSSSSPLPPGSVIFSGIQPTGMPHLGNYLGAMRQWVRMQDGITTNPIPIPTTNTNTTSDSTSRSGDGKNDTPRLVFSIVDLHAITVPRPAESLARNKREGIAALVAVGLKPEKCLMFWQSDVPAHSELMWILSCQTAMGMLSRMTQWKDKSAKDGASNQRLGLLSYPVLQAADVLVHGATHVPVGGDQAQHIEFARYIARVFNHAFKTNILKEPVTIISPTKRIMSFTDPTSKMSKSNPSAKSRISIISTPAHIRQSIRAAVTDMTPDSITYDPSVRPGVSNLLDILSSFDPKSRSPSCLAAEVQDVRALKHATAEAVVEGLAPIRERYLEIIGMEDGRYVDRVAAEGAAKARGSAEEVMRLVKDAVGLGGGTWKGWQ